MHIQCDNMVTDDGVQRQSGDGDTGNNDHRCRLLGKAKRKLLSFLVFLQV